MLVIFLFYFSPGLPGDRVFPGNLGQRAVPVKQAGAHSFQDERHRLLSHPNDCGPCGVVPHGPPGGIEAGAGVQLPCEALELPVRCSRGCHSVAGLFVPVRPVLTG